MRPSALEAGSQCLDSAHFMSDLDLRVSSCPRMRMCAASHCLAACPRLACPRSRLKGETCRPASSRVHGLRKPGFFAGTDLRSANLGKEHNRAAATRLGDYQPQPALPIQNMPSRSPARKRVTGLSPKEGRRLNARMLSEQRLQKRG